MIVNDLKVKGPELQTFDFLIYSPFESDSVFHIPPDEKLIIEKKFKGLFSIVTQQQNQLNLLNSSLKNFQNNKQLKAYQNLIESLEKEVLSLNRQINSSAAQNKSKLKANFAKQKIEINSTAENNKNTKNPENQLSENELKEKLAEFNESFLLLYKTFKGDFEQLTYLKSEYQSLEAESNEMKIRQIELEKLFNKNEAEIEFLAKANQEKVTFGEEFAFLASTKEAESIYLMGLVKESEQKLASSNFAIESLKKELSTCKELLTKNPNEQSEDDIAIVKNQIQILLAEKEGLRQKVVYLEESFGILSSEFEELVKEKAQSFEALYEKYALVSNAHQNAVLTNIDLEKAVSFFEESQKEFSEQQNRMKALNEVYKNELETLKKSLLLSDLASRDFQWENLKNTLEKILGRQPENESPEKNSGPKIEKLMHLINFISQVSQVKPSQGLPLTQEPIKIPKEGASSKIHENNKIFEKKIEETTIVVEENEENLLSKSLTAKENEIEQIAGSNKTIENFGRATNEEKMPSDFEATINKGQKKSILSSHVKFRDEVEIKTQEALGKSDFYRSQFSQKAIQQTKCDLRDFKEEDQDPVLKYLKEIERKNEELSELRKATLSPKMDSKIEEEFKTEVEGLKMKVKMLEVQVINIQEIYIDEKNYLLKNINDLKEELCHLKTEKAIMDMESQKANSELRKQIKNLSYKVKIYEDEINLFNQG